LSRKVAQIDGKHRLLLDTEKSEGFHKITVIAEIFILETGNSYTTYGVPRKKAEPERPTLPPLELLGCSGNHYGSQ
jgi:hypothetical protein